MARCLSGVRVPAVALALMSAGCMSNALPENTDARRAEFIPDPMDPKQMVRPGYMPFMPSAEDRMRLLIQPGSDVSQGMDGFPVVGADSGSTASESRTSANP